MTCFRVAFPCSVPGPSRPLPALASPPEATRPVAGGMGFPSCSAPLRPDAQRPSARRGPPASLCAGKGTAQGVEGTCLPQLAFLWDFLFAEILPFFFCFVFFYFSKR